MMVDENGMPIGAPPGDQGTPPQPMTQPDGTGAPTQQELDQAFPLQQQPQQQPQIRRPPTTPPQPQPRQPGIPPQPRSTPPTDPSQPRHYTT